MSQLDDMTGTFARHLIRQSNDDVVQELALLFIDLLSDQGYDSGDWEWALERADRITIRRFAVPLRAALQNRVNEFSGEILIDEA